MNRLQGQKQGSGEKAFGFLDEKKSASSSTLIPGEDMGFSSSQLQELEEQEIVRPALPLHGSQLCTPDVLLVY